MNGDTGGHGRRNGRKADDETDGGTGGGPAVSGADGGTGGGPAVSGADGGAAVSHLMIHRIFEEQAV
ncbi:hypothetical protein ACFCYB_11840 [Streptomyces sp. NPDC056309]|uniref:hypothetical protein n=1 Tax=unclassified Streptomyces TaxID=2593676 RepID=UPI0035D8D77D